MARASPLFQPAAADSLERRRAHAQKAAGGGGPHGSRLAGDVHHAGAPFSSKRWVHSLIFVPPVVLSLFVLSLIALSLLF